jgi:hypothetical protein
MAIMKKLKSFSEYFVSGHDFSRADNAKQTTRL